ncbi:MAG TPA: hypothetical protein VLJ59_06570 [Mycobacteriales bacterium]|nr:hypothetical protein [Mycobacteriales bacterium]
MSYRVRRGPGVTQAIERLLSATEGLHRLHLDRLDPDTRRSLRYRILYRINDRDLVVIVVAVGAMPRPSRRRP